MNEIFYKIFYQEEARQNLKEIALFYANNGSVEVANKNIKKILDNIDSLQKMPHRSPLSDFSKNIYKLNIYKLPYIVFFKIIDKNIYILNIFNSKRNLNFLGNKYKNF